MADNKSSSSDKRGLASADDKTKERVAKAGGEAYHKQRGAHGSDDGSSGNNKRGKIDNS